MKYEEYIKKLDVLNEEFEEGLLLELQEKPPTNLHGEIMKSINKERRKVNFFNYRIYAPAVAAVLIFAVVINRPEILEKLNFTKNVKITQEQTLTNKENNASKNSIDHKEVDNSVASNDTNAAVNTPEVQGTKTATPNNSIQSTSSGNNNTVQQKDTKSNGKKDNTTQPNNDSNTKIASNDNTNASPAEESIPDSKNESEEKQLIMSNYLGFLYFKEPDVNYEIVLDVNKSSILNFITENYEEKLNALNTYKLSIEQFDSLDKLLINNNINKKVINESVGATSKVVKINFVNYHITINDSQPEIVKFFDGQEKSVKIDDNTYKVTLENMSELDKIINSSGIKKEFISEAKDEYIIFKTLIVNYEINIDASQTAAVSFLKDNERCVPIKDNIYKLSRESLNKLKELITDPSIEVRVINETNNQDIIIKVNNI